MINMANSELQRGRTKMIYFLLFSLGFEISSATNGCRGNEIDLFIVFDTTFLSEIDIVYEVNFTIDLLSKLKISENRTRVSTTSISKNPNIDIEFKQYTDLPSLSSAIRRRKKQTDSPSFLSTLNLIRTTGFKKHHGGRPRAKRVVLLFITRTTNDSISFEAERFRKQNFYVITIGIGVHIDHLATNRNYSFTVPSVHGLSNITHIIADLICEPVQVYGECPPGWTFYNCSCYRRTQESVFFEWGNSLCHTYNPESTLATIHDQCTFFFLNGNYPHCWIGIKRIENKTIWWIDNSSFVDEEQNFISPYYKYLKGTENQKFPCGITKQNKRRLHAVCSYKLDECKTYKCTYGTEKSASSSMFTSEPRTTLTALESESITVQSTISTYNYTTEHKASNTEHGQKLLKTRIRFLKSQLKLDRHLLSAHARKLKSAVDNRVSSKSLGAIAAMVIGGILMLFVLSDYFTFFVISSNKK